MRSPMIIGEDEYAHNRGDPKGYIDHIQPSKKRKTKPTDCCTRDTKQENNVGNDHGRDSVAPRLHFSSFFLFFLSFSFFFQLLNP